MANATRPLGPWLYAGWFYQDGQRVRARVRVKER
jgi:hypothetical protein